MNGSLVQSIYSNDLGLLLINEAYNLKINTKITLKVVDSPTFIDNAIEYTFVDPTLLISFNLTYKPDANFMCGFRMRDNVFLS